MNNKAYVIMQGVYSDRHVVKVCLDEALANSICEVHNKATGYYSPYYIEEYDISCEPYHGWTELEYTIDFAEDGEVIYTGHTDIDDITDYDIYLEDYTPHTRTVVDLLARNPNKYTLAYTWRVPIEDLAENKLEYSVALKDRAMKQLEHVRNDAFTMQQLKQGSRISYVETEDK